MRNRLALSAAALLASAPLALSAQQKAPAAAQPPALLASAQAIPLDRVVAVVGDVVITQSDVTERLIRKRSEGAVIPSDSAGVHAFVRASINELVEEELLIARGKELKIEVPDADVSNTVDKQLKEVRSRFPTESEYRTELAKAGYGTPDEYKRFLTDQVKRDEMIQRTVKKLREEGKIVQANVTDADVQEAYDRAKGTLPKREANVGWRQIIVAPHPSAAAKERARAKAETLLAELKAGAEFELLARRESMDPGSKDNGGDLGWNRRGKMVPEFERWMFSIAPGQLSPVVETAFGFHIIRVDRIQAGEVKAHHILIAPVIDSADVARAKLEADSVALAWQHGAAFDSLARKHHDFRSGEETTLLTPYPRAQLPTAYQQGFADHKAGDFVVFPIGGGGAAQTKYVVAQIASMQSGGDLTLAEVKERFRSRLAEEGGIRRLMESLRKSTYVNVHEDAVVVAAMPPAAAARTTP
ncbi:MAG: SurA protein [Gemmatimonadetes bacterium]|jgi:peptidyl-prolyl cis-trans isomerase SurA|nr:SurA protein [Gemmatimonadota bacterium]